MMIMMMATTTTVMVGERKDGEKPINREKTKRGIKRWF